MLYFKISKDGGPEKLLVAEVVIRGHQQ